MSVFRRYGQVMPKKLQGHPIDTDGQAVTKSMCAVAVRQHSTPVEAAATAFYPHQAKRPSLSVQSLTTPIVSLALLITTMCLCAAQQGSAQAGPAATATPNTPPLQVGSPIPDEVWDMPLQVVNHPDGKETITLADYKDKLIILDFWATWCIPCIKSLQKLDTLQGQFGDGLAVIPTTYEDAGKSADFFKEKGWSLPTAVSENILKEYFPYQSIPHQVWIKDGKVLTIAGPEYASADYIAKVLQGEDVDFDHKIEVEFDKSKPLFLDGNGGDGSNMIYQSVISGRLNARISGMTWPSRSHILVYNYSIHMLYKTAIDYLELMPFTNDRYIIYEVDDTLRYRINPQLVPSSEQSDLLQWATENEYCYNLVLPDGANKTDVSKRMLQDLNEFFGMYQNITVAVEKRNIMALAIVKSESYQDISTKGGEGIRKFDMDRGVLTLKNQTLKPLISRMNVALDYRPKIGLEPYTYPIVDETGIKSNIDLTISADFGDVGSVKAALNKYGLDLVEKITPVEMIVFKYDNQPNK
ncbi:redoxin domain-containing protein [Parapedobacter koreensis]|uniref:Thiol-disulfide isomerase or thioredoxin n=1 Tax=Parapedobacter koreensis TaxID=332977 RepID=A0A1H7P6Z2_9SPHI|nr:redoxin domain-containing protein [Parapedobacter koreensis]SEL31015.1 Thiol-disulfide isomerase or thioredoxin [Parapedobacter koreensis]